MRSQEQARADAQRHADELVRALQDADADEDVIDAAEAVWSQVSDE